jgi:hypothetical protein
MASKRDNGKNTKEPNQPPSREVKYSVATSNRYFELPLDYIASEHTRRYQSEFTSQTVPKPAYTS